MTGAGDRPTLLAARASEAGRVEPGRPRATACGSSAVWAAEQRRTERETAPAASGGNPRQSFRSCERAPCWPTRIVEVEEWVGRRRRVAQRVAGTSRERDVRARSRSGNQHAGGGLGAVARAPALLPLVHRGAHDRHYVLERATGVLRFGEFVADRRASHRRELCLRRRDRRQRRSLVRRPSCGPRCPYLTGAVNVSAGRGGADAERREDILAAWTAASSASRSGFRGAGSRVAGARGVAWRRARALSSLRGPDGHAQRRWITLLVVPRSVDAAAASG